MGIVKSHSFGNQITHIHHIYLQNNTMSSGTSSMVRQFCFVEIKGLSLVHPSVHNPADVVYLGFS